MRTRLLAALALICSCWQDLGADFVGNQPGLPSEIATQLENHGCVTVIFRNSLPTVISELMNRVGGLKTYRPDQKGSPAKIVEVPEKDPTWLTGSAYRSVRTRQQLMTVSHYKLTWLPPEIATQSVAKGGKIKPLPSTIEVTVGSLKDDMNFCFVTLERRWSYSASLHFPYTGIPLGRAKHEDYGLFESDITWVKKLGGQKNIKEVFFDGYYWDKNVFDELTSLKNADNQ